MISPAPGVTLGRDLLCSLEGLTTAMAVHDPHTSAHQERVATLARQLARRLRLDVAAVELVGLAGRVHDIGKLGVPLWLLQRPRELGPSETLLVRSHAILGAQMLRRIGFPNALCDLVRHHHERLDGSGYPDGLSGRDLSIETRVLAVADVVDAMLSARPYRPARALEDVLADLQEGCGPLYDPRIVDVACGYLEEIVDEARLPVA